MCYNLYMKVNKEFSPCKAMKKANISDPHSQEGIAFCTNSCPYKFCYMLEKKNEASKNSKRYWAKKAREMKEYNGYLDR